MLYEVITEGKKSTTGYDSHGQQRCGFGYTGKHVQRRSTRYIVVRSLSLIRDVPIDKTQTSDDLENICGPYTENPGRFSGELRETVDIKNPHNNRCSADRLCRWDSSRLDGQLV